MYCSSHHRAVIAPKTPITPITRNTRNTYKHRRIWLLLRALLFSAVFSVCHVAIAASAEHLNGHPKERIAPPLADIIKRNPPNQGVSAEVLQKRVVSRVDESLLSVTTTYLAIRIQDDEAVQDYSQIHIPYNNHFTTLALDFARVRDPEGKLQTVAADAIQRQTPQQSNFYQDRKELVFSLPSLRPGSVIEFQYQVTDTQAILPGQWFDRFYYYWWEGKANYQARLDQVRESIIEILIPKKVALRFGKLPAGHAVKQQQQGQSTRYLLTQTDLPAIKPEASVKPDHFQDYYLEVTTIKQWQQIEQWARDLIEPKMNLDGHLRGRLHGRLHSQVQKLANNMQAANNSRDAKIRAVYAYLQNNVRYVFAHVGRGGYEPHFASQVDKNAYGDCKDQTVLAITLLRALGVTAFPALVSTDSGAHIDSQLPYVGFNHMITYIPAGEGEPELWLDTSGSKALYPGFHSSLENRPALIIDDDPARSALVTMAPRPYHEHGADMRLTLTPGEQGKVLVDFEIHVRGSYEDHYRSWWAYTPEREKALRQFVSGIYTSANFVRADMTNTDSLWQPVMIKGQLSLDDVWLGKPEPYVVGVGVNQLLRMFESIGSFDTPQDRVNDFHIAHGYRLNLTADIKTPATDYVPFSSSAGPSISNDFFRLTQSSQQTATGYQVKIQFEMPDQLIPKMRYEEFYQQLMGLEKLVPWVVNFNYEPTSQIAEVPDNASAQTPTQRFALVQNWLDNGEFEKALQEAQALVEAFPDNGEAHYFLGLAQGYTGYFEKSNRSFAKAVELGYEL